MKISAEAILVILLTLKITEYDGNDKFTTDSKMGSVKLVVKLPDEMELLPVGVIYRSNVCHKKRYNSDGKSYTEPGFKYTKIQLKKEKNGSDYSSLVPSDGGGQCDWKLSNVTIDIQYRADAFKGKVDHVVGSGIIVIFDDNHPQRDDGVYEDVTGDLLISKRYFPWINERFLNGHSRDLWTYSKRLYSTYKTKNTYKILFAPESNSDLITYSIGPKVKNESGGNFTRYIYPDGEVVNNGDAFPDFNKLENISSRHSKKFN
ncbi:hypothetical protein [Dryocola sp. LX212]